MDFDHSHFDPATLSLSELQCGIWTELTRACGNPQHPWRLPCLANVFEQVPQQRIVVLRHVDHAGCVLFAHTDVRSAKVEQLKQFPAVSWVFYDSERRIQLIMKGTAKFHLEDAIADQHWNQLETIHQIPYLAPRPPGEPCAAPSVNLPPIHNAPLSTDELARGRQNFAVMTARICQFDILFLRQTGHLRARFLCNENGWQRSWLQP